MASSSQKADSRLETLIQEVHRSRAFTPSHSPYVGTFHRGYAASNAHVVPGEEEFQERARRIMPLEPWKKLAVLSRCQECNSYTCTSHHALVTAQEALNLQSSRGQQIASTSKTSCQLHRPIKKTLSFADILDYQRLPQPPELCGLQAVMRGSGVRILEKLGEGTFARVVLALSGREEGGVGGRFTQVDRLPEGTKLVLKCIRKEHDEETMACVTREIKIHSLCRHPNIPRLYGHYESEEYVTLVMDFIEGRELRRILDERRCLPEEEVRRISFQVLQALEYMHNRSLLHCDVSPRNILVTVNLHAFLIDMGLAREEEEVDARQGCPCSAAGTLGYVAPESLGGAKLARASDVWAMGCVLYESMFGFSPFLPTELLDPSPLLFPEASWGMTMSEEGQGLLTEMLQKERGKRISSSMALRSDWFLVERVKATNGAGREEETRKEETGKEETRQEQGPVIAVDLLPHQLLLPRNPNRMNYAGRVVGRQGEIQGHERREGAEEMAYFI